MNRSWRIIAGAAVFVAVVWRVPHWFHPDWAHALLAFAALVLAPMLIDLVGDESDPIRMRGLWAFLRKIQFPAALLLVISSHANSGTGAALAALPWAAVLVLLAMLGAGRVVRRGVHPEGLLCRDVGLVYCAVGAAWLLADRLGLRPLGFDPAIVLLTAVHFHYAGWVLPVVAGLALENSTASWPNRVVGWAVMAGVPAVAIGITASQLGAGPAVETAAALLMAFGGAGAAALHIWIALEPRWPVGVRCLWITAASSLLAGMLLAALYGVRNFFHPWPWLDLPWMRVLHGSVNALGFGFFSVLGWWLAARIRPAGKGAQPGGSGA